MNEWMNEFEFWMYLNVFANLISVLSDYFGPDWAYVLHNNDDFEIKRRITVDLCVYLYACAYVYVCLFLDQITRYQVHILFTTTSEAAK